MASTSFSFSCHPEDQNQAWSSGTTDAGVSTIRPSSTATTSCSPS
ncbi:hypothetical protein [Streptomyces sp. G44]|nr:hypothetical protein [Streptomyces sp. G44]